MAEIEPGQGTPRVIGTNARANTPNTRPPGPMTAHAVEFDTNEVGEIIWIPSVGSKFTIIGYHVSFVTEGIISVWQGEMDTALNRIFCHNGAVQGGAALTLPIPLPARVSDSALKYTTDAVASGFLTVFGYDQPN